VAAPTGDAGTALAGTVASRLRDVADFPQAGVIFKDIAPLLADGKVFGDAVRALAGFARECGPVDLVAGIEARGFLFAAALAHELGCGVVTVRKAGKLPPPTIRRAYDLEYGQAEIDVPVDVLDGRHVYLVDDVLATGGTVRAAADLIVQAGGRLSGVGMLLELGFLNGRQRLEDLEHGNLHVLLHL
jgi:adenine phosphoribosyltransferase